LFDPLTLYVATCATPVHVVFAFVQLKAPERVMETVAPDQVPGASTIVPRSRSCTRVSERGFVGWALTFTTAFAAKDGLLVKAAEIVSVSAIERTQLIIPAPDLARRRFVPLTSNG
jgi:hypothetical protein